MGGSSKEKESATVTPASKPATRKRTAAAAASVPSSPSSSTSPPDSSTAAPNPKEPRLAPPERRAAAAAASKSWKQPTTTTASAAPTPAATAASKQSSKSAATIAAAAAAKSTSTATPPTPRVGSPTTVDNNSKAADKSQRGLRHFSMMVCKKVEEKGTTTYNEVADELVKKVVADRRKQNPIAKFDEKNIRRRVYDALNVLMAMDIIAKDKKEISWKGLPVSSTTTTSATTASQHAIEMLERERDFRKQQVERKREALRELLVQQVCFRNLVQHNHRREEAAATAAAAAAANGVEPNNNNVSNSNNSQNENPIHDVTSSGGNPLTATTTTDSTTSNNNIPLQDERIPLPFIVVNTHSFAIIQCEMSPDREEVMFDFSMPFEINDDNSILKRLGMHKTNIRVLQEMLPDDLLSYCQEHGLLDSILVHDNNKEGSLSLDFTGAAAARMPSPQESG